LRHTAASLRVSAGANVKSVQRAFGHASAAMTLDVYAGLFDDDLDGVAERLDQARPAEWYPSGTDETRGGGDRVETRPLTRPDVEPPDRFELSTYALRVRRSAG
jgi:hypothetical protein